ncbi:MAG: class I SAM-dependent methyltransferase [Nitrospirae bacterium]|nr:class I SAM-dependent methyltransferase [Nitrospirota bacterium]
MAGKAEFRKYGNRGAYHWDAFSRSIRRHNPYLAGRYRLVLELLECAKLPGRRLLDIGCGDGALSYLMTMAGWDVTGLDYSPTGLGFARDKFMEEGAAASFMRGDSCMLPVKDGSLDAVVAADIIEHLTEQEAFLAEIARVLKPGGAAVITTPVKVTEIPVDPEHVREFYPEEFRETLGRYFGSVEIIQSHPADCVARYNRQYRFLGVVGRMKPYKYIYNVMSSYVGNNPFLGSGGGGYTQMSAICRKR